MMGDGEEGGHEPGATRHEATFEGGGSGGRDEANDGWTRIEGAGRRDGKIRTSGVGDRVRRFIEHPGAGRMVVDARVEAFLFHRPQKERLWRISYDGTSVGEDLDERQVSIGTEAYLLNREVPKPQVDAWHPHPGAVAADAADPWSPAEDGGGGGGGGGRTTPRQRKAKPHSIQLGGGDGSQTESESDSDATESEGD